MPTTVMQGSSQHRSYQWFGGVLAAILLVALPFISSPKGWYKWVGNPTGQLNNWMRLFAFAVAILGLNLLIGFTGQISIGHSAFVGLGAYATVLTTNNSVPYYLALPIAFVICFIIGCIVGLPALRIKGLYLVVVTFALAIAFPTFIEKYESFTGGSNGLKAKSSLVPKAPFDSIFDPRDRMDPLRYRYFVCLIVAVIMFVLARNIVRGRFGRGLIALRDNPTAATVNGVSVPVYKVLAFGLSAGFCGVAGWMFMAREENGFASIGTFSVDLGVTLIIGLVMGGVATVTGAIPGAFIVVIIRYILEQITSQKEILGISMEWLSKRQGKGGVVTIAFGVMLVIFVFFLPGGVIDGLRRLRARFVRVLPRPGWLAEVSSRGQTVTDPVTSAVPTPEPAA
jgi:branched-chain amino acid transport system permease protein